MYFSFEILENDIFYMKHITKMNVHREDFFTRISIIFKVDIVLFT